MVSPRCILCQYSADGRSPVDGIADDVVCSVVRGAKYVNRVGNADLVGR